MVGLSWRKGFTIGKGIMQGWLGLATFPNGGEFVQEKSKKQANVNVTKGKTSYMPVSRKYLWGALGYQR